MPAQALSRFGYTLRPVRVLFGCGAVNDLEAELARAHLSRPFILTTPGRAGAVAKVRAALGGDLAGSFERAQLHVPASVVSDAADEMARSAPGCLVAVGGGSAIGLGKALAVRTSLPFIAVPTTYSGSEMTEIWGITDAGAKRTQRDRTAAPQLVLYDPELTLSLPPRISAASGMNAIAHAVEALYAPDANPVASLLAEDALRTLARALPDILQTPDALPARTDALRAAHLAGTALNLTTMGLHHKLCHVLGGAFGLPHAETHAALLPYVVAYNADAARDAMATVAASLGGPDAAGGLYALDVALGLTTGLRDLGLRGEDLERGAALATEAAYPNPRPVTREGVLGILRAAFEGRQP